MTWWILAGLGSALADPIELGPGDDLSVLEGLQPGDEVIIGDGVYETDEPLVITARATAASPVVLRPASGAAPVIRSDGIRVLMILDSTHVRVTGLTLEATDERYEQGGNGLLIVNSTDVIFEDGVVRHTANSSVFLSGDTARITIRNSELSDTLSGNGIFAGCADASCWTLGTVIERNYIHDLRSTGTPADGIRLAPGCQGNVVRDNVIVAASGNGIATGSTDAGDPNVVEGNAILGVEGSGLRIDGDAMVRNNVVAGVGDAGFYSENSRSSLRNLTVGFNTFADTGGATLQIRQWSNPGDFAFVHNVVANPVGVAVDIAEGELGPDVAITGNVVTGLVTGLDPKLAHFVIGASYFDFQDASGLDFYPTAAAAARWTTSDVDGPAIDFNGLPRADAPTTGAYEYQGIPNPGPPIARDFKAFAELPDDTADTGDPPPPQTGDTGDAPGPGDSGTRPPADEPTRCGCGPSFGGGIEFLGLGAGLALLRRRRSGRGGAGADGPPIDARDHWPALDHPHRLPHAVTEQNPRVEHAHPCLGARHERAVQPAPRRSADPSSVGL